MLKVEASVIPDLIADGIPVAVPKFVHGTKQGTVLLQSEMDRTLVGEGHFIPWIIERVDEFLQKGLLLLLFLELGLSLFNGGNRSFPFSRLELGRAVLPKCLAVGRHGIKRKFHFRGDALQVFTSELGTRLDKEEELTARHEAEAFVKELVLFLGQFLREE